MISALKQSLSSAIRSVAPEFSLDAAKFENALFIQLGLLSQVIIKDESSSSTTAHVECITAVEESKTTKRVVSKKMKDTFLATGKSEDDLKRVMKAYKDATDDQIRSAGGDFASFAAHVLAQPVVEEPKKTKGKTKDSSKPEPRVNWKSQATQKVFKEVVEAAGNTVSDDLKKQFAKYINDISQADFEAFSIAGHIRSWVETLKKPAQESISCTQNLGYEDEEFPDEDLEEFQFKDETLLIGEKSRKIYRPTEDAGDVCIGVAGVGQFKEVK